MSDGGLARWVRLDILGKGRLHDQKQNHVLFSIQVSLGNRGISPGRASFEWVV